MILLDGEPAPLESLLNIHEDALVAWDRDGVSDFVSEVEPDARFAHVRVWWKLCAPIMSRSFACIAFASVSSNYMPRLFLVADGDSVRWTRDMPRAIGSTR